MAEEKRFKREGEEFAVRRVSDCEIRVIGEKGGQAKITAEPSLGMSSGIQYTVTVIDPATSETLRDVGGSDSFNAALHMAADVIREEERKQSAVPVSQQEACAALREAFDRLEESPK